MIELRPYQVEIAERAANLLSKYKIAYLSMQVRTGKTLTALKAADNHKAKSVLFITKKKCLSDKKKGIIGTIEKDYNALNPGYKINIINYEKMICVNSKDYDLIICDESHCLGQFPIPAGKAKRLKEICKGKPIIFLSGTPTPESFSQLYHQLWISGYSPFAQWPNFYKWANEFVNKKVKYVFNREINDYSNAKEIEINKFCKHLFISYTQEEAGFIQDVKEEVLFVKMKKETYNLADKMRKKRVHIGVNGTEILADTEVKLLQKLHQIYSGTVKAENGEAIIFDRSKIKLIKEKFIGKKIAIFYFFKAELQMIENEFNASNITDNPTLFNESKNLVFVSQVKSGREGINLSTADALVMMNIDYSAVSYLQAKARIQTKDRIKPCMLYWIFSDGGIEEKIYKTVLSKQNYTTIYFKKDFKICQVKQFV